MNAPLGPWLDAAYGGPPPERTPHEIGTSICQLLTEVLAELRRMNSIERTGAVSSVEIKDLASGKPQICTKRYAGSEPEVDEALANHAHAHREYERLALSGWAETVAQLANGSTEGCAPA